MGMGVGGAFFGQLQKRHCGGDCAFAPKIQDSTLLKPKKSLVSSYENKLGFHADECKLLENHGTTNWKTNRVQFSGDVDRPNVTRAHTGPTSGDASWRSVFRAALLTLVHSTAQKLALVRCDPPQRPPCS